VYVLVIVMCLASDLNKCHPETIEGFKTMQQCVLAAQTVGAQKVMQDPRYVPTLFGCGLKGKSI
jgi:hypothetical protein